MHWSIHTSYRADQIWHFFKSHFITKINLCSIYTNAFLIKQSWSVQPMQSCIHAAATSTELILPFINVLVFANNRIKYNDGFFFIFFCLFWKWNNGWIISHGGECSIANIFGKWGVVDYLHILVIGQTVMCSWVAVPKKWG